MSKNSSQVGDPVNGLVVSMVEEARRMHARVDQLLNNNPNDGFITITRADLVRVNFSLASLVDVVQEALSQINKEIEKEV